MIVSSTGLIKDIRFSFFLSLRDSRKNNEAMNSELQISASLLLLVLGSAPELNGTLHSKYVKYKQYLNN